MAAEAQDTETCPVCADTGPPVRHPRRDPAVEPSTSPSTSTDPAPAAPADGAAPVNAPAENPVEEDEAPLHWIACNKCSTWYHGACVLQGPAELRSTVPDAIREAVGPGGAWADEGEWAEWVAWLDKWQV